MKRIREPQHANFREPVAELIRAMNKLKPEEQPGIRKRHRNELRRQLRKLEEQMEADFPLVKRAITRGPPVTFDTRQKRLLEADFVEFIGVTAADVLKLTAAGAPVRRLKVPGTGRLQIWTRRWAWILRHRSEAELAQAAASPSMRKVLLAEEALKKGQTP